MSPKINQVAWRQGTGFAICLIAIFALAGVPIPVAIKAVLVIATQIVSGAYIYSRIPRSKSSSIPEYLGMGFTIGSALSTLCDIFLKSTPIESVAWLAPTFVIILVVAGRSLKRNRDGLSRIQATEFEFTDIFTILVISFLYLAHDLVWYISLFVSGLCILVAVNLRNRCKTRGFYARSVVALTALATASLLAGIRFRSPFWWINSDDYQLFESMQISLARYGPRDHLGAAGIPITSYHFLPYAWTGLVDRISTAPTWVILNRVTPVVVSVIVSALVWSFLSREGVHGPKRRFILACLFPLLFVTSFGSPSSAFGLIFLLAAIFYWTNPSTALNHFSRIPLGILFTVFVIGTKISNAPVIFLSLSTLALIGFATNQHWKWVLIADLFIATATGAIYYFLFLRYVTATNTLRVELFGYIRQIYGDLNELNGRSLIVIGGIAASTYIIIPFFGLILVLFNPQSRISMFHYLALPIFSLLLMYILFIGGHGESTGYFVNSALGIILLIALLEVSGSLHAGERNSQDVFRLKIFSVVGWVAGFTSHYLLENIRSGSRNAMFGRAVVSANWIPLVLIGFFWFFYDIGKPKSPRRLMTGLSLILVGVICANATVAAIDLYQIARQPRLTASDNEPVIGTPHEIAIGIWIDLNLPINTIIASNHFCGREKCYGSDWFNEQVDLFREYPQLLNDECSNCKFTLFGGSNFILPVYSKRRFLIQGPRFLWGLNVPPTWAIDRVNATLDFANSPSTQAVAALRKYDVEYFVVDLESTSQKTWLPFGKLLYQNPSFAILQLTDEQ